MAGQGGLLQQQLLLLLLLLLLPPLLLLLLLLLHRGTCGRATRWAFGGMPPSLRVPSAGMAPSLRWLLGAPLRCGARGPMP